MPPPEAWVSTCQVVCPRPPRSSANIAYTDQPQAATMPRETSVSIEDEPCLAFFSATRWNGHAHHSATGAAQPISSHCPPGDRTDGISDSTSETSVSGTK